MNDMSLRVILFVEIALSSILLFACVAHGVCSYVY